MKSLKLIALCACLLLPLLAACDEFTYPGGNLLSYEVTEEPMRINIRDVDKAYTLTGVVIEFDNKKMEEVFEEKNHYIKEIVTDYLRLKGIDELLNEPTERFAIDISNMINQKFDTQTVKNVSLPGFVVYQ